MSEQPQVPRSNRQREIDHLRHWAGFCHLAVQHARSGDNTRALAGSLRAVVSLNEQESNFMPPPGSVLLAIETTLRHRGLSSPTITNPALWPIIDRCERDGRTNDLTAALEKVIGLCEKAIEALAAGSTIDMPSASDMVTKIHWELTHQPIL